MHCYAKRMAQLQAELEAQMNALQRKGDELLHEMRKELDASLQRLKR